MCHKVDRRLNENLIFHSSVINNVFFYFVKESTILISKLRDAIVSFEAALLRLRNISSYDSKKKKILKKIHWIVNATSFLVKKKNRKV